jgi:Domain of unknown function (DUF4917)
MSFADAIADSEQFSKRHLLLGNGFSIACRADIFHYGSLYSKADFSAAPEVSVVFDSLGTQDFEAVIRVLESASRILLPYVPAGAAAKAKMLEHAALLKEILIQTIAGNHPDAPFDIPDEKFWACRRFLANFLAFDGQVFTLNYDLLLYWALMHDDEPGKDLLLVTKDGFGNDEDDPTADYVVWQGEIGAHDARVHFLHGALHLFDSGSELKKYTWVRKGVRLIEQARDAINQNSFPLFVTEGNSSQKKSKIRHNAYLYQGLKQLTANIQQGRHTFFIYGHSLADNDDHILNRLARGRFPKLYVAMYGDPDSAGNRQIVAKTRAMSALRNDRWPLDVAFFDAASANVWG